MFVLQVEQQESQLVLDASGLQPLRTLQVLSMYITNKEGKVRGAADHEFAAARCLASCFARIMDGHAVEVCNHPCIYCVLSWSPGGKFLHAGLTARSFGAYIVTWLRRSGSD